MDILSQREVGGVLVWTDPQYEDNLDFSRCSYSSL